MLNQASDVLVDRGLPASVDTEKVILGAMMLDGPAFAQATDKLEARDFYLDSHRRIYQVLLHLDATRKPIDYMLIRQELELRRELDTVGGWGYVLGLTDDLPRRLNVEEYVRIVKERASQRELLKLSEELAAAAVDGTSGEVTAWASQRLEEIADNGTDEPLESVGAYITREQPDPQSMFSTNARSLGVLTPWASVNTFTCGLQPTELVIVAGRPSMGKSALALNLVDYVARISNRRTAFFSTEMSMLAMLGRLYCGIAKVNTQALRNGSLSAAEKGEILYARSQIQKAPLYMTDTKLTATAIRAKALRLHRTEPLDLIVVDQLSGVSREDCKERDKHQKIGEQTRTFKELAKELSIPVVVLNQLTRASTERKDSRPTLSDLKESGSLEEDADVVVFVHRPEYFDRNDPALSGKGEIIIAKQRNGPVGTANVGYTESLCLWKDSEQESIGY